MALYCSVDPSNVEIQFQEQWLDQEKFWGDLKAHSDFHDRKFPDKCDPRAWNHSLHTDVQSNPRAVVLTASMDFNPSRTNPVLILQLLPLKLETFDRYLRRHRWSQNVRSA